MILNEFKHFIERPTTKKVEKLWGFEYWIINQPGYCWKLLELKEGFQCSLHFHRIKAESFAILAGRVQLEVAEGNYLLIPSDIIHIYPGTEHRFTGLTDALISEHSTHHEDSDSYRLEPSKRVEYERDGQRDS